MVFHQFTLVHISLGLSLFSYFDLDYYFVIVILMLCSFHLLIVPTSI